MSFWGFGRDNEDETPSVWSIMEKKYQKVAKTMEEPVLPSLCKVLFVCMLISTAAVIAGELVTYFRYAEAYHLELLQTMVKLSYSALTIWSAFSWLLILLSTIQICRLRRGYQEKVYLTSEDEIYSRRRFRRTAGGKQNHMPSPQRKYELYLITSIAGILLFGISYLSLV